MSRKEDMLQNECNAWKATVKELRVKITMALDRAKGDWGKLDYCPCGYTNMEDTVQDVIKILEGK